MTLSINNIVMKQLLEDIVQIQAHGTCVVRIWLKYYVTYIQSFLIPRKNGQYHKYNITKAILIKKRKMILF